MSPSDTVSVDFNHSIFLSPDVAAAYRREVSFLEDLPAFEDRIFYVQKFIEIISAWRFAACITSDQYVWMIRSARFILQRDLGIISDISLLKSAVEADEFERNRHLLDTELEESKSELVS